MRKSTIVLTLISVLLVTGIIIYINPRSFIYVMEKINPYYILLSFLIVNLGVILRVFKWYILLEDVKFTELFPIQVSGMAISNLTPGKIGEPVKALFLKYATGKSVSRLLPSILWERALDLIVMVLLSLIAVYFFSSKLSIGFLGMGLIGLLIIFMILFVENRRFGEKVFSLLKRIPLLKKLNIDVFYESKISKKRILASFLVTLVVWILDGSVFYLLLLGLGITLGPVDVLVISGLMTLSIIVGLASALPGGVGSADIVFILFLSSFGIDKAIGGPIVLLGRAMLVGYGLFLGYISFLYLTKKFEITGLKIGARGLGVSTNARRPSVFPASGRK